MCRDIQRNAETHRMKSEVFSALPWVSPLLLAGNPEHYIERTDYERLKNVSSHAESHRAHRGVKI